MEIIRQILRWILIIIFSPVIILCFVLLGLLPWILFKDTTIMKDIWNFITGKDVEVNDKDFYY